MKKNYIIDTNVMLHDPNFIDNFGDNNIIIPVICLEELNKFKGENSIRGLNARAVLKRINTLRIESDMSLHSGIKLPNEGTLKIELDKIDKVELPDGMNIKDNDNKIIAVAKAMTEEAKNKKIAEPTILVTKDVAMSLKADSLGITVQDYENDKVEVDTLYKGIISLKVPSDIIDTLYTYSKDKEKTFDLELIDEYLIDENNKPLTIYPNQYLHLTSNIDSKKTVIARCELKNNVKILVKRNLDKVSNGRYLIKPRNLEQSITMDLLQDDKIPFVSISGDAGSGKTIMAMSVAMDKVERDGGKIILVRPVVPAGDDIGFLPGTEEEKLKPWMGAFYDAIETILKLNNSQDTADDYIEKLQRNGQIEIKSFTYMRGRTLSNAIVLLDESQEITPHIAKLMLTRIGENTKIIMTGDPSDNQIDNSHVNSKTNGLVYVIEKCKNSNLTGHVELQKVERSALADLFNKVL